MPPLRGVTFYSHVWRRTFLAVTKGTRKAGWSPGVATRAEIEVGLPERGRSRLTLWTWSFCEEASLHVTTPLSESADDELRRKAGADPFRSTDCEIPKDKASARFGRGK